MSIVSLALCPQTGQRHARRTSMSIRNPGPFMSSPRETYSRERPGDSHVRRSVDRNHPVASSPMMVHKYSVIDVDFQVQTKCEFNDIKSVFMVISSKRGWLLTTALAQRIQHTGLWNDVRVTPSLPENGSVGGKPSELCQKSGLCLLQRHVAKMPRQAMRYGSGRPASPARRFSMVISIMRRRVRSDALPRCGVSTRFCSVSSG